MHQSRPIVVVLLIAAAACVLFSCATTSNSPSSPTAANSSTSSAAAQNADRQEVLGEAVEQVLLAREQARLGLIDEAREAWDRAIIVLSPLATTDQTIAEQIREIEAERDQAVQDAEARAALQNGDDDDGAPDGAAQPEEGAAVILESPEPALDPSQLPQVDQAAHAVAVDYPVVLNDRVYAWLEAWTGKLSKFFTGSLERSGMYTDRFRRIFAEEGVPQDLVYMAHVESGFKTSAYSRAKARGIFQFITGTGRRYGLTVNYWLDDRADPEKSCRAAAGYLRDLYAEFGDWYLALAAYNAGEGKVRAMLARTRNRDFWAPANQRFLRRETRNYVPAIIAATLISKNPAKFGFGDVRPMPPLQFETVTAPPGTSLSVLATCAQTDAETLRQLNPALRRHATPTGGQDYRLRVPVGSAAGFVERLAQVPPDQRLKAVEHVVRRGETLSSIGRRYGVSVASLRTANQLSKKARLHAGQVLIIPDGGGGFEPEEHAAPAKATNGIYTVRRGDTLSRIGAQFGVSVQQLQSWNGLGGSTRLSVGQKLRVSAPAARSTPAPTRTASAGAASASRSTGSSHTVRPGETLWRISQRYGVSLDDLCAANGIDKQTKIAVGQRLAIPSGGGSPSAGAAAAAGASAAAASTAEPAPAPSFAQQKPATKTVHVVRRGDTLFSIARRYGSTVAAICELNSLSPGAILRPGDKLTVTR